MDVSSVPGVHGSGEAAHTCLHRPAAAGCGEAIDGEGARTSDPTAPDAPISEVRLTLSERRRADCRTRAKTIATRPDGKWWVGLDREARIILGPLACPATTMREARRLARQPGVLLVVIDDLGRAIGTARHWAVPVGAHDIDRVVGLWNA